LKALTKTALSVLSKDVLYDGTIHRAHKFRCSPATF
jgi:hypothetical protein